MEAALRFAYQAVTGEKPDSWDFKPVRGLKGQKDYTVTIKRRCSITALRTAPAVGRGICSTSCTRCATREYE